MLPDEISEMDGSLQVNPTGGPALGSGGTGDVLTGAVTGFLAQGLAADDAAALAVWLHGHAADRLARLGGDSGLLAGDLAEALPAAAEALRETAAAPLEAPSLRWAFPGS